MRLALGGHDLDLADRVRRPPVERDAVDQHERLDVVALLDEELRDAAPGRVPDERHTIDVEGVEQLADVAGLRADVERDTGRLVRRAEPEQVGREHPVARREHRDQASP